MGMGNAPEERASAIQDIPAMYVRITALICATAKGSALKDDACALQDSLVLIAE